MGSISESMDRIADLNAIVAKHDLNNHPFYQEWVAGTLPFAKLQAYAADYGHFIGTIANGWETLGRQDLAEEERYHETLWKGFQEAVDAGNAMKCIETAVLVELAKKDFALPGSCVGALYAFEAQQPKTAASKLAGLEKFYSVDEKGKEYFKVHANDVAEIEILHEAISKLSDKEFAAAKASCANLCRAMWVALDGVYRA